MEKPADNIYSHHNLHRAHLWHSRIGRQPLGGQSQEAIEKLMKLDYSFTVFLSGVSLAQMKAVFEQCKELMGVDDEDLTAFTQSRIKNLSTQYDADSIMSVYRKELGQNIVRLEEAKNESRAGETSVGGTPDTGKQ